MVIFLEDIHWADDSSLDLLNYLVTRASRDAAVMSTWRARACLSAARTGVKDKSSNGDRSNRSHNEPAGPWWGDPAKSGTVPAELAINR